MNESREEIMKTKEKYLRVLDTSLTGRVFHLAMDDGEEYELRFVSGDVVEWRRPGEPLRYEKYGALQVDEKIWFGASVLSGTEVTTCVSLVLDVGQSLTTMVVSRMGLYPRRPRVVVPEIVFGAIRVQDRPLPVKRHSYTRDLAGKKVTWHYSSGFVNTQIYLNEHFIRIRPLTDTRTPEQIEQEEREIAAGIRPRQLLYEEPAWYVKIDEGVYLVTCVESNMNRVDPARGGNNLLYVSNMKTGRDYGRCFSRKADMSLDFGFFIAFGEPCDEDIPVQHAKSPYRV